MDFERAFAHAGSLLIGGLNSIATGGIVAGFRELREGALLVDAGFTRIEAIKIASTNGTKFSGKNAHIGPIAVGSKPT